MNNPRSDWDVLKALSDRPGVGGGYFNPAGDLPAASRSLATKDAETSVPMNLAAGREPTYVLIRLFEELVAQLGHGELLFALYERAAFTLAPYLYDVERLSEFECQVSTGSLVRRGYYAVPMAAGEEGLTRDFY